MATLGDTLRESRERLGLTLEEAERATRIRTRHPSRRPLGSLDGRALTESQFADRFDVRVVPVLMAFDANWRPMGDPLVGIDRAGFYESYVERLIADARRRIDR